MKEDTEKKNTKKETPVETFPSSPKGSFNCPISTYVPWFHGFIYKTCPVCPNERDMSSCGSCSLRGNVDVKSKQNDPRGKRPERKEKGQNRNIPKIGKTYSSDQ